MVEIRQCLAIRRPIRGKRKEQTVFSPSVGQTNTATTSLTQLNRSEGNVVVEIGLGENRSSNINFHFIIVYLCFLAISLLHVAFLAYFGKIMHACKEKSSNLFFATLLTAKLFRSHTPPPKCCQKFFHSDFCRSFCFLQRTFCLDFPHDDFFWILFLCTYIRVYIHYSAFMHKKGKIIFLKFFLSKTHFCLFLLLSAAFFWADR